jgi:hypothetical protein
VEEFVSLTRTLKSRRAVPGVRAALGAVVVMLVGAGSASAAPAPVVSKLTAPLGAIQAPDGRWWVSDHLAGFCRVTLGTTAAPGAVETATCLGGGVPVLPGPASAGAPVFHDPTPAAPNSGDEMAYVPDGATGSRSVDRLAWNPASQTFSMVDAVSLAGADPDQRPAYAALGPDGNLYVGTLRTTAIQRIVDPEGAAPKAEVVGTVDRLAGLAAGRDASGRLALYAAEPTGVTRLYPDAAAPGASQPTNMALGLANAATPFEPGALAYDMAANALYVGTASAAHAGPVDKVMRFAIATSAGETLDTGYDTIGGLSLAAGALAVFDGPAGDTQARMSLVADARASAFAGPLPAAAVAPAPAATTPAPVAAGPAPVAGTGRSAVARIARLRMSHRLRLQRLRSHGLRITLQAAPGTTAVDVRVLRRGGPAATRLRATYHRALKRTGRVVFTVPARALRRVGRGRYVVAVTPLAADSSGATLQGALRITR